jgi:anti-sigma factor RsiW
MTSNFENFNREKAQDKIDNNLDDTELDYFELLSAYIDNELNPQDRQRVEYWLDNEPEIKHIYRQLLQLQSQIQNISPPAADIPADLIVNGVFDRIESQQRQRKTLIWGAGAIAATIVALVSGSISGFNNSLKLANSTKNPNTEPVMVAVALNKPAVKIPKAAVASPQNKVMNNE